MIQSYAKKSNIAAAIALASIVALAVIGKPDSPLHNGIAFIGGLSMIAACALYLKAKGRSLLWLFLLPVLTLIALIVYYFLGDQSNLGEQIKCSSCSGSNFNTDSNCRYCNTPLSNGGQPAPTS